MSKQLLELTSDHEEFDFDDFKDNVWPKATPVQKAWALSLSCDQGDFDNVNPALFRNALIYGYSDLVSYLWGQASDDQKYKIKYGRDKSPKYPNIIVIRSAYEPYNVISMTWFEANWAKDNGLLPNVLDNFNFMMQQYTPEEQAEIIECECFYFWERVMKKPVELIEAYWSYANDDQKKLMLLNTDGFTGGLENNIYFPTTLFWLQRVVGSQDKEITEAYSSLIRDIIDEQALSLIECVKNANLENPVKDKVIAFVLTALSGDIDKHFERIALFGEFLQDKEKDFPLSRKAYFYCDKLQLDRLKSKIDEATTPEYLFSLDPDRDFRPYAKYCKRAFSFTLEDPTKRYTDILFEKMEYRALNNFYHLVELVSKTELSHEEINLMREVSAQYFKEMKNWAKPRVSPYNYLYIRLANLIEHSAEDKVAIFSHLLEALKQSMAHPGEMSEQDAVLYDKGLTKNQHKYLHNICDLKKDLLVPLVAYVIENDNEFADELLKVARLDDDFKPLLRAFHNLKSKRVHESQPQPQSNPVELLDEDVVDEPQSVFVELLDDEEVSIKDPFFRAGGWDIRRASFLAGLFGDLKDKPESLQLSLNEIAGHARRHLNHDWNTTWAKAGREKYNQLVTLFDQLRSVEGDDRVTRLTAARELIANHLEETPKESSLLKNRGGFFGAYKTMSKFLNWVHFHHYSYGGRTAVSTTDHLLIKLYDEIDEQLKTGQEEKLGY